MRAKKEYAIVDKYGRTHFFYCYNKTEARDYFNAEIGRAAFDYFTEVET